MNSQKIYSVSLVAIVDAILSQIMPDLNSILEMIILIMAKTKYGNIVNNLENEIKEWVKIYEEKCKDKVLKNINITKFNECINVGDVRSFLRIKYKKPDLEITTYFFYILFEELKKCNEEINEYIKKMIAKVFKDSAVNISGKIIVKSFECKQKVNNYFEQIKEEYQTDEQEFAFVRDMAVDPFLEEIMIDGTPDQRRLLGDKCREVYEKISEFEYNPEIEVYKQKIFKLVPESLIREIFTNFFEDYKKKNLIPEIKEMLKRIFRSTLIKTVEKYPPNLV